MLPASWAFTTNSLLAQGIQNKAATLASGPWSSHWAVPASAVHQSAMMALAGWLQTDRKYVCFLALEPHNPQFTWDYLRGRFPLLSSCPLLLNLLLQYGKST
jgi:hypothetical protein